MKALVYTGPETIELRDVPEPVAGDGEVLVAVAACGICGSDMHAYHGHDERRPAPLILGHEAAGRIVAGPESGLRVTINPLVTCGRCAYCRAGRDNLCPQRQIISMPPRPGAFAERVAIPRVNCIVVGDGTSDETAALVEPVACGWHAVRVAERALGHDVAGLEVLVLGGGAIGVAAALSAKAFGAAPLVVEPHAARRQSLAALAHFPVAGSAPDRGFGLVIDAVGVESTRRAAFAAVAPGGVIVHIGLGSSAGGVDARRATLHEIAFIGTYTYTSQDFRDTASALFSGRLGPTDWHEMRAMRQGPQAFRDLAASRVDRSKIILRFE